MRLWRWLCRWRCGVITADPIAKSSWELSRSGSIRSTWPAWRSAGTSCSATCRWSVRPPPAGRRRRRQRRRRAAPGCCSAPVPPRRGHSIVRRPTDHPARRRAVSAASRQPAQCLCCCSRRPRPQRRAAYRPRLDGASPGHFRLLAELAVRQPRDLSTLTADWFSSVTWLQTVFTVAT